MTLELNRKTVVLSVLGFLLLASLVFVAGMVVAVRWYLPTLRPSGEAAASVAGSPLRGASVTGPAASGARVTPPRVTAPRVTPPRVTAPRVAPPRVTSPRVASPRVTTTGLAARGRTAGGGSTAAVDGESAEPPSSPGGGILEEAYAIAAAEGASYAVQVGAFRSTFNVENLMLELRDRGYQPYVVRIERNGTVLHTVRIGDYPTEEEAIEAAASFHQREGIAAVVRLAVQQNLG